MNEPLAGGEHQKVGQKGIIRNGQDLVYKVLSFSDFDYRSVQMTVAEFSGYVRYTLALV